MTPVDYYKILELSPTASEKEIKSSYRRLVIEHHPDSCGSGNYKEEFYKIQEAYNFLSNKEQRRLYDEKYFAAKKVDSWQGQDPLAPKNQTKEDIIEKLHCQNKQNISNIQSILKRHATSKTLTIELSGLRFQNNLLKNHVGKLAKNTSFFKKLFKQAA